MRALGFSRDLIERTLYEIDPEGLWIRPSLDAAGFMLDSEDECLVHLLGLLEPGAPSRWRRTREPLRGMLMSPERLSLGVLGRRRLNLSVHGRTDGGGDTLSAEDIFGIFRQTAALQLGQRDTDDVDHLGNRRVRRAGELIYESFRQGLMAGRQATVERLWGMESEDIFRLGSGRLISFDQVDRSVRNFFSSAPLPVSGQLESAQRDHPQATDNRPGTGRHRQAQGGNKRERRSSQLLRAHLSDRVA